MTRTFKVLSVLLGYPTPDLQLAAWELRAALADEGILTGARRRAVNLLIDELMEGDIYDLQERYLLLFDRTRSLSLHLFEHVHGESRDRGQAMIDLKALYETSGLGISATELPDYLPMFLEFLSMRPLDEARELLGQATHILEALAERLAKRGSAYAAVFEALAALAPAAEAGAAAALIEEGDDPNDLAALDEAWEDKPVSFGPGSATGCRDDLIARMRAAKRPATVPGKPASTGDGHHA
jgi:nitrate reductase delta subunit